MKDILIFEQPINEYLRACLRLEYLFQQAIYNVRGATIWDSRTTIAAITDILSILDRPDLKTKFTKELSRHLTTLNRLEQVPHIDHQKLAAILLELEDLIDLLNSTTGKIGQELRDNEFINSIRQYLMTPGGAVGFDTPAYQLWLNLPAAERIATFAHWLRSLETVHAAVNLLLKLTRQSCPPQAKVAQNGFYQATLDPQAPCQLVRVGVHAQLNVYPELSVSRHGICIRFFNLTLNERAIQTIQDIPFNLTTCIF